MTILSDEEIKTAGVFALVMTTGSSNPLHEGDKVISLMPSNYNFLGNNCQHFATKLVSEILHH